MAALSASAGTWMAPRSFAVDLQHQLDALLQQRSLVDLRPGRVEQLADLRRSPAPATAPRVVCGQAA